MIIVTIIGARPQFIKAAAVNREICKHDNVTNIIVHTGQHFDANMSNIFFEQMHIPRPHYNLDINSLSHGAMTGQMLEAIEEVLLEEKPDWVMVYGDTNSTLAGALAAKKLHIKVAHVEAGLRSFNMKMPEEVNRILTDRISDVLFSPTETALNNLKDEGYDRIDCKIVKSGDVMQDAALFYTSFDQKPKFDIPEKFILLTIHRAENTDKIRKLTNIIDALNDISKEIAIVFPLHPRTKKLLETHDIKLSSSIIVLEPVGYLEMVYLLKHCNLVMTDSGGLQKEAYFFKKSCITLRDETEWVELVENGFNVLAAASKEKIIEAYSDKKFNTNFSINLYGNGNASKTIVESLLVWE